MKAARVLGPALLTIALGAAALTTDPTPTPTPALAPAGASFGSFSVLTYNVAGLPDILSSGDPATNTTPIGQRLPAYNVVNVQEDFNYHAALYAADTHLYRTPTSGGAGLGDGLNTLSDYPIHDFARVKWSSCNGTDCLTPKGFSVARIRLAEGVLLDLYNLHPNAGTDDADLAARRANITQISTFMQSYSAGNAVIVMGDTNTRYTRGADNIRDLVSANGLTDAWVQYARAGTPPAAGSDALVCDDTNVTNSCEVVDKILYRGNRFINLSLTRFNNENAGFRTSDNKMLSDHYPIGAWFSWSLNASLQLSDFWGGEGGTPFTDVATVPIGRRVTQVNLRAGSRVDQVGLVLSDGTTYTHGGTGGTARSLTLSSGEYLTSVTLHSGTRNGTVRIFYVRFTTSWGRTVEGGTTTTSSTTLTAPSGWQISGFHGRSGDEVDKLGLIYTPASTG